MANKIEGRVGGKSQLLDKKVGKQEEQNKKVVQQGGQNMKVAQQQEQNKMAAEQGKQITKKWPLTLRNKQFIAGWRRFVLWSKKVFLIRKDYVPGDTCRFIWQKVPEVKRTFVYYRIAHMVANFLVLSVSLFHISMPYDEEFCNTEPVVLCIGRYVRLQYEWFFYATSWGVLLNFVQSAWGLVLALRLYLRQRSAQRMTKDVENGDGVIGRSSGAPKKSKDEDCPEERKSMVPRVLASISPFRSPEGAQSKGGGLVKPLSLSTGSKTLGVDGPKKQQEPKTSYKDGLQDSSRTASKSPGKGEKNPSKYSLAQDNKQSMVLFGQKSVLSTAELVKKVKNAQSPKPIPDRGAGADPHPTREHLILSITGFYWGLHSYCTCSSLLIDTVYWTMIWPNRPTWPRVLLVQVDEHAFNFVLMIIDYCLVAFPVCLSHLWFTTVICVGYFLMNCIYYYSGGLSSDRKKNYIYDFLNWKKPVITTILGLSIAGVTSIFLLLFLIIDHYKFKLRPKAVLNNSQKH